MDKFFSFDINEAGQKKMWLFAFPLNKENDLHEVIFGNDFVTELIYRREADQFICLIKCTRSLRKGGVEKISSFINLIAYVQKTVNPYNYFKRRAESNISCSNVKLLGTTHAKTGIPEFYADEPVEKQDLELEEKEPDFYSLVDVISSGNCDSKLSLYKKYPDLTLRYSEACDLLLAEDKLKKRLEARQKVIKVSKNPVPNTTATFPKKEEDNINPKSCNLTQDSLDILSTNPDENPGNILQKK